MDDLINVIYQNDRPTVSARELHKQLEIEKRFSVWFETNSKNFIEGEDFSRVYLKVRANRYGGEQEIQDYQLTIDMAKHLCLMSHTEKGKIARQYLIDLEKKWNSPDMIMKRALEISNARVQSLEVKVEEDAPKVLFAESVSTSETSILIGEMAKILKQNGVDMGQQRLFKWLRENGYLIKRNGSDRNMPTQKSMELGLFEIKETAITHSNGTITVSRTPKVTGKGQIYFTNMLIPERNEAERS